MANGPRRRGFLRIFGAGKKVLNAQMEIIPLRNDRGENGSGESEIGSDGCKPGFHQAAPRTVRRRKRHGFMVMLLFVIMILPVAIMLLLDNRLTAIPRRGIQQAIRVCPAPREGGDEKQEQETGSELSHVSGS